MNESDGPAKLGRPTKYKPEYCEMLIEHMAIGMTFGSFAGHPLVRVNQDTLFQWKKDYPDFSESHMNGKAASEYFMMELGHNSMLDKGNFNNTMWVFMMKNMHNWRDKVEHEDTSTKEIKIIIDGQDTSL